ncbi:hypothetical protein GCM10009117_10240 [Gangjinia marincola]|uniref:DUF4870 domain-containing protein n=1 Tax=Gangjinia marincola TaxID=578463 RepID=A0ABN1MG23_9FLAO
MKEHESIAPEKEQKNDQTYSAVIHLLAFTKLFIPLGNFMFPLVLWVPNRKRTFVDHHGKEMLNFQLSTFIYWIALGTIALAGTAIAMVQIDELIQLPRDFRKIGVENDLLPLLIFYIIIGLLGLGLIILELVSTITAALKAGEGERYHYPLSIPFISTQSSSTGGHSSINSATSEPRRETKNEQSTSTDAAADSSPEGDILTT